MAQVLVAVSNGAVRASIAGAAHAAGHGVYAVADAGECLEFAEQRKPDVLFLDPDLARISAVQLLRNLRLRGLLPGMRIVLVVEGAKQPGSWETLARQSFDGLLDEVSPRAVVRAVEAVAGAGMAHPREPAPSAPAPGAPASGPGAPVVRSDKAARPSLLLVEDTPAFRALVGMRFDRAGWQVDWAGSAEEGLEKIERTGCEFLLSDINLPGMSGDELALVVRKRFPGVRVFLMTALPRDKWPKVPADIRIFPKPLDMEALFRALERAR